MMWYFAHPWLLYILLPTIMVIAYWRWFWYQRPVYQFPLARLLVKRSRSDQTLAWWVRCIFFILRLIALGSLIVALARLQQTDETSYIPVEGIDIMLVLDVSESMTLYDDPDDLRTRREVACTELLKFIQRRSYDPMGLVIFGAAALSRCPLTLDKQLLMSIVQDVTFNYVLDPQGTVMCMGLAMAANRLRVSTAKSKIIILLTDGAPTAGDILPEYAIDVLVNLGIKVYVIGVGFSGGYLKTPFGFVQQQAPLNVELLDTIAKKTGGQFFQAHKPADVEHIYSTIDTLEKSTHDTPLYARYIDWFMVFLIIAAVACGIELTLRTFVWVAL